MQTKNSAATNPIKDIPSPTRKPYIQDYYVVSVWVQVEHVIRVVIIRKNGILCIVVKMICIDRLIIILNKLTENKVRTFTIKMRDLLNKIEYILSQAKTTQFIWNIWEYNYKNGRLCTHSSSVSPRNQKITDSSHINDIWIS
jgi:hypothetical protein